MDRSTSFELPRSPTESFKGVAPGARRSTSRQRSHTFSSPQLAESQSNKSVLELRKVLSLIVARLQDRPKPPSIFEQIGVELTKKPAKKVDAMVESLREAMRIPSPSSQERVSNGYEADDEDVPTLSEYSTKTTLDLMIQLRDILVLSHRQGWEILPPSSADQFGQSQGRRSSKTQGGLSSPFRRRRSSAANNRPRLDSDHWNVSDLRSTCITILEDVIMEDCRYKVLSPRLLAPPNALQAVTLDVALSLLGSEPNPSTSAAVAHAIIPAFASFDVGLHPRLLAFFENGVLRQLLFHLRRIQGGQYSSINEQESGIFGEPIVAIQVDHALEEANTSSGAEKWTPWSRASSSPGIVSSSTPFQSMDIYRLASVIPPLLAAMLDSIDITSMNASTTYHAHRLFQLIVDTKVDAYLDLLQVVAYHSSSARQRALRLLSTYWPDAIGHVTVTQPFSPPWNGEGVGNSISQHEFIPWRFSPGKAPGTNSFARQTMSNHCHSCGELLHGFGLVCTSCPCVVHFNCYDSPDGSFLSQYPSPSDPDTHKVSVTRFSRVLPVRQDADIITTFIHMEHEFNLVHLFTMTTCFVCHMPLWGCTAQGLQCTSCRQFVHSSCVGVDVASCTGRALTSLLPIDWSDLRESFVQYYRDILLTEEQIMQHTHEDIAVYYGVLWTQLQLLMNGIASGCMVVEQTNPSTKHALENRIDEFELQYCVRIYEAYLSSGRIAKSAILEEYQRSRQAPEDQMFLYDWPLLMYMAACAKMRPTETSAPADNFLSVYPPTATASAAPSYPTEITSLAHIRDALACDLNILSDPAARCLMVHLHTVGLFRRVDFKPILFEKSNEQPSEISCSFPLPLLLDTSADVETLVAAIEGCLSDIDLSVNEMGFLLLTKRCRVNVWVSEYGLGRLAQCVLSWILSEDERLLTVAGDYVTKGRPLPGVLASSTSAAWPPSHNGRPGPSSSSRSGGEYVASRRLLLNRFAAPWMRAFHHLDEVFYAQTLFDHCKSRALDASVNADDAQRIFVGSSALNMTKEWGEEMLRLILKLCQSSVIYSAFDAVFVAWLDVTSDVGAENKPGVYPSLPRLFNMEAGNSRYSVAIDRLDPNQSEPVDGWNVDPWHAITEAAAEGTEGLQRALRWLLVLAKSGVGIPMSTYMQMAAFIRDYNAPFETNLTLIECITATCWLKSSGAQDLLGLIIDLHARLSLWDDDLLLSSSEDVQRFFRLSLAASLLLYGFERETVVSLGLLQDQEAQSFPSRKRTIHTTMGLVATSLGIDWMTMISRYVTVASDDLAVLIVAFLNTLISENSPLGSQDVDNFIAINTQALNVCAWTSYGITDPRIASVRAPFVLRLLVVNAQSLEDVVSQALAATSPVEIRHSAINRLLIMIQDINSPYFQLEDRQWRPCVVPLVQAFFGSFWNEPTEELRLAVDVASRTLMTAHFEALSRCWDEYLLKASFVERVRFVSFLLQLRPYFPRWRLLSWETIVESMLEDDYLSAHGPDDESGALEHMLSVDSSNGSVGLDEDVRMLRVLLVTLSLQLIGDGIVVDLFTALKIKHHLTKVLSFSDCQLVPSPSGTVHVKFEVPIELPAIAHPCINALLRAMDGSTATDLPPSAMGVFASSSPDTSARCRSGAIFADVILSAFNNLDLVKLPYSVSRGWLEVLIVFILKYDIEHAALRHLSTSLVDAVKRLTELMDIEVSLDLRQLALSATHAFLQTRPNLCAKILRCCISIIFTVSALLTSLGLKSDNVLVAQGKAFMVAAFNRFAPFGLFKSLLKRDPLPDGFFEVLRQIMKEDAKRITSSELHEEPLQVVVLRDTLAKIFDVRDGESSNDLFVNFGRVTRNLHQFVEQVFHEHYTEELIEDVSHALTHIARRTAEWPASSFDPNPFLVMSATIVQHNKSHSRDILLHMETLLRASLVRFSVSLSTLERLFRVTGTLYRRASTMHFDIPPNHLALAVLEILTDELRAKRRAPPSTLDAMLETVCHSFISDQHMIPHDVLLRTASHAFTFLDAAPPVEHYTRTQFSIQIRAATLSLYASLHDRALIDTAIAGTSNRPSPSLRVWSSWVVSALEHPQFAQLIIDRLPAFSLSYANTLQSLSDQIFSLEWSSAAAADLSHAYASIKLWMLLVERRQDRDDGVVLKLSTEMEQRRMWNELWPPFENLVLASISVADDSASPMSAIIWSSYVDLVMFILVSGSVVAIDSATTHITLLERLCEMAHSDSSLQKFTRAMHALQHLPSRTAQWQLVEKAKDDFLAAEKLTSTFHATRPQKDGIADRRREFPDRRKEGKSS